MTSDQSAAKVPSNDDRAPVTAGSGNLTRVTLPAVETGEMEFWLSDVEMLGVDDDEWGFTAYGNKDIFIATFVYSGKESAEVARRMMAPALADAVFIATS